MKQASKEFVDWLKAEMKRRNRGVRDMARFVGVSHPTISDIVTNGKAPSFETVMALSITCDVPAVSLLRMAGLIPPEPEYIPLLDEWNNVFYDLTEEDREEILEIARIKSRRKHSEKPPINQTSRSKRPARNALKEE